MEMLFAKTDRRIPKPKPMQLYIEPFSCIDTTRYLGVILDTWLTWSTDIDRVRKWLRDWEWCVNTQRGVFSIGNRILLYKQLIRPVMDYVSPNWRSAARTHVRKLQVLHSKCLCIATSVLSYSGNGQIHEDL
jgi:hypothetical protein